eukprot:1539364-Pleurochrysis_carterae.AAC.1
MLAPHLSAARGCHACVMMMHIEQSKEVKNSASQYAFGGGDGRRRRSAEAPEAERRRSYLKVLHNMQQHQK